MLRVLHYFVLNKLVGIIPSSLVICYRYPRIPRLLVQLKNKYKPSISIFYPQIALAAEKQARRRLRILDLQHEQALYGIQDAEQTLDLAPDVEDQLFYAAASHDEALEF